MFNNNSQFIISSYSFITKTPCLTWPLKWNIKSNRHPIDPTYSNDPEGEVTSRGREIISAKKNTKFDHIQIS